MTLQEKILLSEPKITFCECFNGLSSLWNYNRHCHEDLELIYRSTGEGLTQIGQGMQHFTSSTAILYPVGCWHQDRFPASEQYESYCLWVHAPNLDFQEPLSVKDQEGFLGGLFRCIYKEYTDSNPDVMIIQQSLRLLLLALLRFNQNKEQSISELAIQEIIGKFREPFSVGRLAEQLHVSRAHLERSIRKKTGHTPLEILHQTRIREACGLLVQSRKSVSEIASLVGYENEKYFFRIFRRFLGMTPLEYRRREYNEEGKTAK